MVNTATTSMSRWLCLALLFVPITALAEISVSIEPNPPVLQESFRIIFTTTDTVDGDPDFSPLSQLFEILGQNRNTSVNWVNGKHSRTTTWHLEVISQNAGDIVIPAIKFGTDTSAPTRIAITDHVPGRTAQAQDLILEIEVDENEPYVQQQVLLTARLLRRVDWSDAQLSEPTASGDVIFKQLTEDKTYQDQRDGRAYEVFERRFALFPQASGPMTIAPLLLTAHIARQTRSFFDPFRSSTSTRRIRSNALEINVKPVPQEFTGDVWLPARRLKLRDEWQPNATEVQAGEPITRTLFLWTDGLTSGQLPDFPPIVSPNANVYPDQAQANEQENATGFNAVKQQKFAIIASDAGTLEFPPIEIPWWDIDTDSMQISRIEARTMEVLSGTSATTSAGPAASPMPAGSGTLPGQAETAEHDTAIARVEPWRTLALAAFAGWLLTVLIWGYRAFATRRAAKDNVVRSPANHSLSRLRRDVARAAAANNPSACRNALLAWARTASQDTDISTLSDVATASAGPLAAAISELNAHLYGRAAASWDGKAFAEAFENSDLSQTPAAAGDTSAALKPLFRLAS